ncbi:hypothetical protein KP509_30G005200 [Ceratopteris richardii]|uniref:Uncharacterized protein n=1 Tax=Ceratopteris richardii TaxID=49495 RepID=A0A8T2QZC2_CERRI|nr:hypothetical protein KP509_30G005000 [Ceratopteris richardii]KAH7289493.1 hypothetical protein KP509_30G005100 [Ceratopteris richardii]KAH7289494.1 hypothetical protein KP509_30G005200 [Ceratopteris richardii]
MYANQNGQHRDLGSNAWKFNKLLLNRRLELWHTEDAFGRSLDILKFRFLS